MTEPEREVIMPAVKYYHWLVRVVADLKLPPRAAREMDDSFNQTFLIAAQTDEDAISDGVRRTVKLASDMKLGVAIYDCNAIKLSEFKDFMSDNCNSDITKKFG